VYTPHDEVAQHMDAIPYQMDKIIQLRKDQLHSQTYGPLIFHCTHKTGLLLQHTVNVTLYSSHSYPTTVTLPMLCLNFLLPIPAKCLIHNNPIDTH